MPFGLLIGVVLVAWGVACALASRPRLGGIQRITAVVVNELPFVVGYLLVASVALALIQGDLGSPGGVVVAALAGLDLVGLAVVVRRALLAHRALGNSGPPRRPWGRILRAPVPAVRPDVASVRDLSYGAGRRRTLDVYHRRDRPSGVPIVLHFHGGGFHSGDKRREARPLIGHLVQHGIVCVSANYRLRPDATHAEQLADVCAAIEWVKAHAGEYGGDASRLVLAGSSAGAYLAIEAVEQGVTGVAGLVGRYGYYGDLAPQEPPPLLVIHGENDLMVSASGARAFVERAQAASRHPVIYAGLPGAHHDFDLYESIRSAAINVAVESFLARVTDPRRPVKLP
jgi:acetyl esterase/lipase